MRVTPFRVYLLLCAGLVVLMIGQTSNRLWSNLDFWTWLGPVREFAARPLDPSHPLMAVEAPDSYMGPYALLLGLVTRATGGDPVDVLALAGLLNALIIVTGLRLLANRVSRAAWAPPLALVFTLVAWGWQPWRWSGYPNLNSLGVVLPLGSTFAYGTGLVFLAALWQWLEIGKRTALAGAVAAYALTVLTHQPTGLWVALVALGFVVGKLRGLGSRRTKWLLVAAATTAAVVAAWPYYSVIDLSTGLGGFDGINSPTYGAVIVRTALALPGLVILGARLRRNRADPLALAALVVGAAFVFGWVTDSGSLGRMAPGLMLVAHLAMADWFGLRLVSPIAAGRRTVQWAFVAIVTLGLVGTAPGWVRSVPRAFVPDDLAARLRLTSYVEPNLAFAGYFAPNDVVAATSRASMPIGGGAAKVVSVWIPQPFIADAEQRLHDIVVMLDPKTPSEERTALLARYRPSWLVVESTDAPALVQQLPGASVAGEVNGFAVIRLRPAGAAEVGDR